MLIASEVTAPGMYWYYEQVGGPPRLVEVTRTDDGLAANVDHAGGDGGPVLLERLRGSFDGPVRPAKG